MSRVMRERMKGRDDSSTSAVACGKSTASFSSVQAELFREVLQARECGGYHEHNPRLTHVQMLQREAQKSPTWKRVAIIAAPVLGAVVVGIIIWQVFW